ncbi:TRAP transporter substrate-binding protein [Desulfocicer niacini]
MRNRQNFLSVSLLIILMISGSMAWAKPVPFKFAHFAPPNEPAVCCGQWIEEDLNKNAKDIVTTKFFHSSQMGSTIEIVKKVKMGMLQGGFMTGNYAPDLSSKFGIGTLAYCMDSYKKWNALLENKALRDELFTSMLDKGIRVVDVTYFGSYGMATTKPVRKLVDLKQMKMRTTQARYPVAFWNAMGVNPVPLAWADVFPSIKQGVVEGTDHTAFVTDLRLADLCKYFTRTNHMLGLTFMVVNEKWYQSLQAETRDVIMASIAKNLARERAEDMALDDKMDSSLTAKGVEVIQLPAEEMAKFKESQMQVWKELEPEIGKEWLDKIVDFTSKL